MSGVAEARLPLDTGEIHLTQLGQGAEGWWPFYDVARALGRSGPRRVALAWIAAVLLSIVAGVAVVRFDLSAIPVPLGFITVDVTVYPPILLGMLLLLWLGPGWAITATYLATFALGAYAGLAPGANLLFSLADPVQLLVVWAGLMVLDVPFQIRSRGNWAFFLALALIGSVGSSLGALVWNYSHELDFALGFRIWQGWVVGAFLQGGLLVMPIHHFAGPRVRTWLERSLELPRRQNLGPRGGFVILLCALLLVAAIAVEVGSGISSSVASAESPAVALAERMPELELFAGLVLTAFFGTIVLFTIAMTRRSERERSLARVDGLTGCLNRLAFAEAYEREAHRSVRLGLPLASLFLDLDHFKSINDDHGYDVGDLVLRETAQRIGEMIRDTDYLFRWGGEEFIILLPHTSAEDAGALARRLLHAIRIEPVRGLGAEVRVTASLGLAATENPQPSPRELINGAAKACREAKLEGRDRVVISPVS